MLADALVQYLVVKRWRNVLLVVGPSDGDREFAAAMKRAIAKFRRQARAGKALDLCAGRAAHRHRPFRDPGRGRAFHAGHQLRRAGGRRRGRTSSATTCPTAPSTRARWPGPQGLVPTAWARPHEQWGATQLQDRFLQPGQTLDDRPRLRRLDGGAGDRRSGDALEIGRSCRHRRLYAQRPVRARRATRDARLSFRSWDGQLRQPVLLADARSLVSVSPQPGVPAPILRARYARDRQARRRKCRMG